jgi:HSP20 family protein
MARWNPYQAMAAMERAQSKSSYTNGHNGGCVCRPALDVIENDDAYVVRASLPGFKAEEIDIKVKDDDVLALKAEHAEEREEGDDSYLLRERSYGPFRRSIRLPAGVSAGEAIAEVADGILTLTLPKREEIKPKQIEIKAT